ncbi:hypothetical protein L6164_019128 [Bauhinia variegata]|uniref:Uncharacterized protein n=1 Tax=Bauhinia variegata TaxID=167791 RepID=A0ACB9NDG6_BAUVA|nr:hypothetical protein L6164_019128 [Bauhinia variegata]
MFSDKYMINLGANYGVPLCLSVISHRLSLPKEMADHDLRRQAIRRQRSRDRDSERMGWQRNSEGVFVEIAYEDLAGILHDHDMSHSYLSLTA